MVSPGLRTYDFDFRNRAAHASTRAARSSGPDLGKGFPCGVPAAPVVLQRGRTAPGFVDPAHEGADDPWVPDQAQLLQPFDVRHGGVAVDVRQYGDHDVQGLLPVAGVRVQETVGRLPAQGHARVGMARSGSGVVL